MLTPEQITAIIDTREQAPLDLAPLATITGTLSTGDYSVKGLEAVVAIERKSLPDLSSIALTGGNGGAIQIVMANTDAEI